jgi:hypothetical protein
MVLVPSPRPDLFISADIETDGPIPGDFSMLSFGLCLAGCFDGARFERFRPSPENSFYAELRPVSAHFQPEALQVNGLDRRRLAREGADPSEAMAAAADWIAGVARGARPVLVAYPVAFDWAFLYWYFVRYTGDSPFGFSSCLDIRTLYQARALTPFDVSSKGSMPRWLLPEQEHTHNAADDALEQAELFNNLFEWALDQGGPMISPPRNAVVEPNWLSSPFEEESERYPPGLLGSRGARARRRERQGRD